MLTLPVVEDKVYVVGEVKAPGAQDFRPDLTPREYVALAGGPSNRAKMSETIVTFRNGTHLRHGRGAAARGGRGGDGAGSGREVVAGLPARSRRSVASLVTAYTGLFIIFGGGNFNNNNND